MDPRSVGETEQGRDEVEESTKKIDELSLSSSIESDISDNSLCSVKTVIEIKPKCSQESGSNEEDNYDQRFLLTRKRKPKIIYALVRPERVKYCPECKDRGFTIPVERKQFQEWKYWVYCPRMSVCWFTRECKGKAVVNTKVLVKCGLPDQLEDHMDIYNGDIDKIIRLTISEYVRGKFVESPNADADSLRAAEDLKKIVACFDGLEGLIKSPEPIIPVEREPTVAVDQDLKRVIAAGFYGLEGFKLPTLPTKPHECESKPDEDLNNNELQETDEPQDRIEVIDLPEKVKLLAAILVADLPIQYKLKVKTAFSKMEGYNFPDDFINVITSGDVKLRRIFTMIDPDDEVKAELLEKLNDTINDLKVLLNIE